MHNMKMIVAIDGNIGAGKSTVLKILKGLGHHIEPEKIEKWPLAEFYEDPEHWSLAMHMAVLTSMKNPVDGIHERCPVSTCEVFWKLAPKTEEEDQVFTEYARRTAWKPDVHILLRVRPEMCFEQIKKRSQVGDEHVSLDYLQKIDELYKMVHFDHIIDVEDKTPETVANMIKDIIG